MAARRHLDRTAGLATRSDKPLIGIVLIEDGEEVTRYFSDEAEADAAVAEQPALDDRALAGAWRDLDWEETVAELERIRHESVPTPPIDEL